MLKFTLKCDVKGKKRGKGYVHYYIDIPARDAERYNIREGIYKAEVVLKSGRVVTVDVVVRKRKRGERIRRYYATIPKFIVDSVGYENVDHVRLKL